MTTPPAILLLATLAGALFASLGHLLATRRASAQPVEQETAAELALVHALLEHPLQWLRVEEVLNPSSLATPRARVVYEQFHATLDASPLAAFRYRGDSDAELDAAIAGTASAHPLLEDELRDNLHHLIDDLGPTDYQVPTDVAKYILEVGTKVVTAANGREQNTARSPFVIADDGTITRQPTPFSKPRALVAALVGAIGAYLATQAIFDYLPTTPTRSLALGALAFLIFISVELACIDLDTFYLDTPVFLVSGTLSWVLAVGAAIANHHPSSLIAGLVIAGTIALAFEVLARGFAKYRGHTQGAGDTWIVIVTAGVPAALVGSWQVGLYSMMAGSILAILFWCIQRARGRVTAETPIAFGPYLSAGWVVAFAWWLLFAVH